MRNAVWMGTRGHEQWIKAPAPRAALQPVGWSATTQGRNGRVTGRRSRVTHMEYDLNWTIVPSDTARKLSDMYYGLQGDGLVHWLDPMRKNALPAHWSFPGLTCTDGTVIHGTARPVAVATAANAKALPSVSARFATSSAAPVYCYIPIPPDHAAHIGVHQAGAAAANSVVVAQPFNGEAPVGTATRLPGIAATDTTRFTTAIPHSTGITGIGIAIRPGATVGGVTLPASGDLAGLMVEVLPIGKSPAGSGFIRGGGNSGCRMFEPPTEVALSAERDQMSVSAKLTEVGP